MVNFNPYMDKWSHAGKYGMKLLIDSQTSTAVPMKYGNRNVISSHALYSGCNNLAVPRLKLNHVSKRALAIHPKGRVNSRGPFC